MADFFPFTDWIDKTPSIIRGESFFAKLISIRNAIVSTPSSNFLFITDFDHTLTKFSSSQCHDVLTAASSVPNFHSHYWSFVISQPGMLYITHIF